MSHHVAGLQPIVLIVVSLTPTRVTGVKRSSVSVCVCVCLFVCLHDRTKTAETTITTHATGIVHHESWSPFNIRSKGQRSRPQGHKVQTKNILAEGYQVAGVSLYSTEWPASSYCFFL